MEENCSRVGGHTLVVDSQYGVIAQDLESLTVIVYQSYFIVTHKPRYVVSVVRDSTWWRTPSEL